MSTAAAGLLVGSWELEEVIGHGGQATVHRARHLTLGRAAALKLIRRSVWADPGFRVRFARECDALAEIDHPNVIPVLDAGECEGRGFLVMRLARAGSLADALRTGALAPARALALLGAVAAAVDAVHAAGRVHRDVTPANILIDPEGGPWLGDFGLARRIDATIATQDGMLVGTAGYLAPEVIAGGRAGPEADRYALAAVAFHALTGRAPFVAPDLAGVLYGHMHLSPPPVAELQPHLPSALDRVFADALSRRPAERPPTAAAMIGRLGRALASPPGESALTGTRTLGHVPQVTRALGPASPPARGRRMLAGAAIGLSALVLGVAGGLAYTEREALPFLAPGVVETVSASTVPGERGVEVAAVPGGAADLPTGVPAPDAVVADVGAVRVVSLAGGAPALAPVRAALAAQGYAVDPADHGGRQVGLRASMPWYFFSDADDFGLMVVRDPSGERALVVRGRSGDVRGYMDGLAESIGARILPAS